MYPFLISHVQTPRQMHTHVFKHNSSPRYALSFYQVSTQYPLPIQSNPHSCEFHLHPGWPKTHPWKLPHLLQQVHPLTYVPIKHHLKYWLLIKKYWFESYLYKLSWPWFYAAPFALVGSILLSIAKAYVARLMCSPLVSNFWSTKVLVHKGLIHGVITSLPWQTGLQGWESCTIALAHSVGYKLRSYWDSPSEGLISYMWIQPDSDLTSLINFQGVCAH